MKMYEWQNNNRNNANKLRDMCRNINTLRVSNL